MSRMFFVIAAPSTGMREPTSQAVSNGVMRGARSVEMEVMVTDRATSALARYEITLEAVPPGAHPTRITPTATASGSRKT